MARRAGPPSLWSGCDKVRVGERLQASLAGLLELQLLKELHRNKVEEALGRRPPGWQQDADDQKPSRSKREDQVEERDGSWLDEILRGSRKLFVSGILDLDGVPQVGLESDPRKVTDLGSDSSLWLETDPQMFPQTTLKAQAESKPHSGETQDSPETDSRPSSGFYEISEVGSSSLSDSCMSVCSNCPGGSHWSMSSLCHLAPVRENGFLRPRSTDEAAVRLQDLRVQRSFGSNGAQTLATQVCSQRPGSRRPVSTGDLDFPLPFLHFTDLSSLPQKELNPHLQLYTCDLVSHTTTDVYRYPSPLHAVALQSPLFTSLSQEELPVGQTVVPTQPGPTLYNQPCFSPELYRCRLERYIAKLVLRHRCRSALSRSELTLLASHQKSLSLTSVCNGQLLSSPPGSSMPPRPASAGWKIRRRISTCSHLRSLDSPEGTRDSQAPHWDSMTSQESGSIRSSTTDVSKVSDFSLGSLLEDLTLFHEQDAPPLQRLDCCSSLQEPVNMSSKKWNSLNCNGRELGRLYRGKHTSQELVKAPVSRTGSEHSWLSPREILRKLSVRKKPAPRGNSCCKSEMDVNAVMARQTNFGSQHWGEDDPREKWSSVLEISSSNIEGIPRKRAQRGSAHLLSRHLSTDSPLHFHQHVRVHLWDQPPGSSSGLGEANATSSPSLSEDWIQQTVWGKEQHSRKAATLEASNMAGANFKVHRARSLKELRRMVCKSMRPFTRGQTHHPNNI
ncbi:uncharacterized protein LOC115481047 [Microcaecilia unicolor]|uniref:Uncharacterized protein LOC115481047 n=1 Tax=Microcaecilia unicolor TaxID=1415580 RepID=A0A6P7Z995_9AMPH|nr:uncharacterized protein LOC115481047 [Microcaecilia unicolor]